jgi:membrane protein implicated in regulation of membrane protease activity
MRTVRQPEDIMPDPYSTHLQRPGTPAWVRAAAVLTLFLIIMGNLVLATMGLLGGARPRGYVFLFLAWTMGITGFVMLARLWRAMVLQRASPPSEPTS